MKDSKQNQASRTVDCAGRGKSCTAYVPKQLQFFIVLRGYFQYRLSPSKDEVTARGGSKLSMWQMGLFSFLSEGHLGCKTTGVPSKHFAYHTLRNHALQGTLLNCIPLCALQLAAHWVLTCLDLFGFAWLPGSPLRLLPKQAHEAMTRCCTDLLRNFWDVRKLPLFIASYVDRCSACAR